MTFSRHPSPSCVGQESPGDGRVDSEMLMAVPALVEIDGGAFTIVSVGFGARGGEYLGAVRTGCVRRRGYIRFREGASRAAR